MRIIKAVTLQIPILRLIADVSAKRSRCGSIGPEKCRRAKIEESKSKTVW